jgi:dienelactone hydrolase
LVLIGAEDTEVSVDWCTHFAAQLGNVSGFEFLLIPDAHHLYWATGTTGYNETAAKLAEKRLKTFLAKHLKTLP